VEDHGIGLDMGHPRPSDCSGRGLWDICDDRRVSFVPLVGEHPFSRTRAEGESHLARNMSNENVAIAWFVDRAFRN
jgi:hypothetical protein